MKPAASIKKVLLQAADTPASGWESILPLTCTGRLMPPGQAGGQLSPALEGPGGGPKQGL